jgi:hypothetical protein
MFTTFHVASESTHRTVKIGVVTNYVLITTSAKILARWAKAFTRPGSVRGLFFEITLSDGRFFSGSARALACRIRRLAGYIFTLFA